jgi:hypothetical protein
MLQHRKQSGIKVRSEGVRPFRLLTRIQRVVLTGIRGNDRLPTAAIPNPLAALRQLAGNKGMIVAAPRTSIVTADEWMMLGALAVAQRQEPILICAPDLLQIIAQCASVLTQANLRLPLPDLARTTLERNGWLRPCPKPCDPERAPRYAHPSAIDIAARGKPAPTRRGRRPRPGGHHGTRIAGTGHIAPAPQPSLHVGPVRADRARTISAGHPAGVKRPPDQMPRRTKGNVTKPRTIIA